MRVIFIAYAILFSPFASADTPLPTISLGSHFVLNADLTIADDLYFRNGEKWKGGGDYCRISPETYAYPLQLKAGEKLEVRMVRGLYFIPTKGDGLEASIYVELKRPDKRRWELFLYCARPKTAVRSDADWTLEQMQNHFGPKFSFQGTTTRLDPIPGRSPLQLLGATLAINSDFTSTGYKKIRFQEGQIVNELDFSRPACFIDSQDGFAAFTVRNGEALTVSAVHGGFFSAYDARPETSYASVMKFTAAAQQPTFQLTCYAGVSNRKPGSDEIQRAMGSYLSFR